MAARLTELTAAPVIRRRRLPTSLVVGGALVLVLLAIAALAQWIAPHPYDQMHIRDRFLPPSLHYLAGTDEYGCDVFSRLLFGSQLSLTLGVTATLISMGIGVPLGLIAGYRRGVTDELITRTLDVMMSFPPIMGARVQGRGPPGKTPSALRIHAMSRAALTGYMWFALVRAVAGPGPNLRKLH
jgi:peptide/nickel transport system permease protein